MLFMFLGIVTLFNPVQYYVIYCAMLVNDEGNSTLDKPLSLANKYVPVYDPMLEGSLNSLTFVQFANV